MPYPLSDTPKSALLPKNGAAHGIRTRDLVRDKDARTPDSSSTANLVGAERIERSSPLCRRGSLPLT
jgi:hypothetical protein